MIERAFLTAIGSFFCEMKKRGVILDYLAGFVFFVELKDETVKPWSVPLGRCGSISQKSRRGLLYSFRVKML